MFYIYCIIAYLVAAMVCSFGFAAIVLPFTNVLPRIIKQKKVIPARLFVGPIFWSVVLFFFAKYIIISHSKFIIPSLIGAGFALFNILKNAILGGKNLEADIADSFGDIIKTKVDETFYEEEDQSMIRGTIANLEDFVNQINSIEDTLSIMFNDSSDFINIKKEDNNLLISYPTVTDRMANKKEIFKLAVTTFKGTINSENDTIIKVRFWEGNVGGLKAVLNSTFKLQEDSILDYQIH